MKKIISGLAIFLVVLGFNGCGKKFISYEKVLSDKYTIDRYIKESLSQNSKYPQLYSYHTKNLIYGNSRYQYNQAYKNLRTKLDNNIRTRHKILKTICSNHGGTIISTTHNIFKKFNIPKNSKSCKANNRELFTYYIKSPYITRGLAPSNVYWNYDMYLVQPTEKENQEILKLEQSDKKTVATSRQNCNIDYFSKKINKECSNLKIYSKSEKRIIDVSSNLKLKEKCMLNISKSLYKKNFCEDKTLLKKSKQKISETIEYDRLEQKCNADNYEYILGIRANAGCKVEKMVAEGGNKPFNWGQCIAKRVREDRALCAKYKK